MKTLFVKLGILIVSLLLLDLLFGQVFQRILDRSPDGRYYKANYSLTRSNEQIAILGSSRAETNYAPVVFEEELGMTCWNAGRGGQGLPFWHALNLGMSSRYSPKLVILNVESDFLEYFPGDESFERAGFLRPFYKNHPSIRSIIDQISLSERFLILSNFYAFNSSFYYLFRPFFFKGIDGQLADKGWKPLEGQLSSENIEEMVKNETEMPLDPRYVKMLADFVATFSEKGSKVVICVSPDYRKKTITTSTLEHIKKMENVTLFNFSLLKEFSDDPTLFKDVDHLNKKGAIAYSKVLVSELVKQDIIDKNPLLFSPEK